MSIYYASAIISTDQKKDYRGEGGSLFYDQVRLYKTKLVIERKGRRKKKRKELKYDGIRKKENYRSTRVHLPLLQGL